MNSTKFTWAAVAMACLLLPSLALADELSGADTAWILTSTALVLFMTLPGLALFYGGLVRSKNVLSVLMQCFAIAGLMSLLWLIVGYSLAFGEGGAYLGDFSKVMLAGVGRETLSGDIPESLFMLFQMTFAIITPALIVGGFAERIRFSAMLIFSVAWLLLVYVPICHWVWGGGWLSDLGVKDFAGGIVVHITAGVAALVGPQRGPEVGDVGQAVQAGDLLALDDALPGSAAGADDDPFLAGLVDPVLAGEDLAAPDQRTGRVPAVRVSGHDIAEQRQRIHYREKTGEDNHL